MKMKAKPTYAQRLFVLLVLFAAVPTLCFLTYQYSRERYYSSEMLNARLQQVNARALDALAAGTPPDEVKIDDFKGLRLTVLDRSGRVLYDSEEPAEQMPNHIGRAEIVAALTVGSGYTICRVSENLQGEYFYSAAADSARIVRTALPYDWSLREMLHGDQGFLILIGITLLVLCFLAGLVTQRLGGNIARLRRFAELLERGDDVSGFEPFPAGELGDISNHIVSLSARLQCEHEMALHEEQEKIRIKRQLTNNINHELKTPVSAIRGYLETMLTTPGIDSATQRNFVERSFAQIERLQQLLQDVATLTRMDEASSLIAREPVNLTSIVEELVEEVRLQVGQRFTIEHNFRRPLPLTAHAGLLASAFRNLIENAVTHSGGTLIRLWLEREDDDTYTLICSDNGQGVGEEHLPHLFERFYRVDKGRSRKSGGTGLGLAIVKNAVSLHGGHIEVYNRPAGGLEFLFTLRKGENALVGAG